MLLGLLVLLVYSGMPADELTFDSAYIIGDDTRLTTFCAESVAEIFREDYWWPSLQSNLYRPLTTLSFWIESSFLGFGKKPFGYQISNVLLHWLNAVLLFHVAQRWLKGVWSSAAVAGIFACHPIAVESVANLVGRSDLFATTSTLGGVLCYLRAVETKERTRRNIWLSLCGACGLLGVLAKESAIVLPAIIALHGLMRLPELRDGVGGKKRWLQDAAWAAGALLPAAAVFLFTRWIYSSQPGVTDHPFIDNPIMAAGFIEGRLTALAVLGMQIAALFAPLSLSNDYSFDAIPVAILPLGNSTAIWGWGTLMGMAAIGGALWRFRRNLYPAHTFSFGAFLVATLPTSNLLILIGSIRADRFQYLPAAFFWLFVAGVVSAVIESRGGIQRAPGIARPGLARLLPIGALVWAVCIGLLAHFRCYDWRSNINLWRSAYVSASGSVKVMAALGNEMVRLSPNEKTLRDAIARTASVLDIYERKQVPAKDWPLMVFSDLGAFHISLHDRLSEQKGREAEAQRALEEGMRWLEKGLEYEAIGRRRWADLWVDGNLEVTPRFALLHRNHILALHRQKRWSEALAKLEEMIERAPFKGPDRDLRAQNLVGQERYKEAVDEWTLMLMIDPSNQHFIQEMVAAITKLNPDARPMIPDASGVQRLNLNDPTIIASLRQAFVTYDALLEKHGLTGDRAKLRRSFKYEYGLTPDEPKPLG
jgi:tetratricopeptide (TPR) repeat protein